MLFRIKYLLGIMATLFGMLYLLVGTVALSSSDAVPLLDRWMPFVLGTTHVVLGLLLFWASSRERHFEQARLLQLLRIALHQTPSMSARDFAALAGISESEACDFLLWASRHKRHIVAATGRRSSVRVWSRYCLN